MLCYFCVIVHCVLRALNVFTNSVPKLLVCYLSVDNLPLSRRDRLLATPGGRTSDADARPLAIGIDSRTRAFDAEAIVARINCLLIDEGMDIGILFLEDRKSVV